MEAVSELEDRRKAGAFDMLKRMIDVAASGSALLICLPFMLGAAVAVRLSSAGPILYRQRRVGKNGKVFEILKFRTMRVAHDATYSITIGQDPRITSVGHFLRQSKIDELPQLLNVIRGDMSLVGPRPEVPFFVDLYPPVLREKILSVRPGITDRASIKYRNEAELLGQQTDPDGYYRSVIMPDKIKLAAEYAERVSIVEDARVLFETVKAVIRPRPLP